MTEKLPGNGLAALEVLPQPQQLFSLTAVAIAVARKQQRLRAGRHYDNARFLRIKPVETSYVVDGQAAELLGFEHKLIGHIRRIAPSPQSPRRSWSLRLGESIWATHGEVTEAQGVGAVYKFEWNETVTTKAVRQLRTLPTPATLNLNDALERLSIRDDAADILSAELQMEQVTQADCQCLHKNIQELCAQSGELSITVGPY